jgi:hypothetical protein
LADLPGDDGESRSLSRRRFADGAEGAEPTRAPAASTRRSVLLKRFFTWLSVLRTCSNEGTRERVDGFVASVGRAVA